MSCKVLPSFLRKKQRIEFSSLLISGIPINHNDFIRHHSILFSFDLIGSRPWRSPEYILRYLGVSQNPIILSLKLHNRWQPCSYGKLISFEHRNVRARCGVGLIHLLKAQLSLDFSAGFHCKDHPYLTIRMIFLGFLKSKCALSNLAVINKRLQKQN